ncbi:MAG: GNAT family N-acetyltransferase, partial [Caldilineaceae bacterium]|nr:GNAT family N-acetyltransferase [Caldilineaceae bacterium]
MTRRWGDKVTFDARDLSSDAQPGDREARGLCVEAVFRGLEEFDSASQRDANDAALVLAIFDAEERIVGGLLGKMLRGWLRIDALWVAEEMRRLGHGAGLMQRAQEIAVAQGCRAAHLDTYSYQAPEF